ncbi:MULTISPECIES: response regulator transcription factor [unclassified Arcicella]|uniref:response regulator transcription factor n=1 Tax=unclassified Arcicella TaxID=2644986 RepID=UPI00285FC54D|nr:MULTISPECIES: response regulator transcription factor [unclassified Arcicella]MDR6560597.1 DNA-binding NarL/FixJ family response regulator [Arcicella sp. BE51]MDR6814680.1 DNA-binding NarL/FixJ family response regulator [Arcicella sp. BE140]MDR6826126.1 DNA-binding NarL/FixJ family response regulator [Arcicella sp. BE139]
MNYFLPKQICSNTTPTLLIAIPDLLKAEMISEWQFSCNFRTVAILNNDLNIISKIEQLRPEFIFIDSELSDSINLDFPEKLKKLNITAKIIIYASKKSPEYLTYFLHSTNENVKGFIHRGCGVSELERCLIEVFAGRTYLSTSINHYLNSFENETNENQKMKNQLKSLTIRELEIFYHISSGKTEKFVAEELNLGINTVKTYKKRITEKMDLQGKHKIGHIALLLRKEIENTLSLKIKY